MALTAPTYHLDRQSFLLDTTHLSTGARHARARAELVQIGVLLADLDDAHYDQLLAQLRALVPFPLCQALGLL